MKKVRMTLK